MKKKTIRFSSKKIDRLLDFINKGFVFDIFNSNKAEGVCLNKKLSYNNYQLPKSANTIPKVLYKTGFFKEEELPQNVKNLFKEIKENNPDISIKYFDDEKIEAFLKRHFNDQVINTYYKLKPGAYKADLFRYCVLYVNGGVYGDLTQTYLKPIDKLVDFERDCLVLTKDLIYPPHNTNGLAISFMAAVKGLPIFKEAIDQIIQNVENNYYGETTLDPTGPYLFRKCFQNYQGNYRLELEVNRFNTNFIRSIRTGKKLIINKLPNHNTAINKNKKTDYHYLWRDRKIYDNNL